MKYLIFASRQLALARNIAAFLTGRQAGSFAPGTTAYAEVLKHPGLERYALPVDERFSSLFTDQELQQAQELSADWFDLPSIYTEPDPAPLIAEHISTDPLDATITRKAVVKALPILLHQNYLVLKVCVEHYRAGQYIGSEKPNKLVELRADNTTEIPLPEGNTMGEFDYLFYTINAGAHMIDLIRQFIHIRDADGRFN
jgi:hypothetical protein